MTRKVNRNAVFQMRSASTGLVAVLTRWPRARVRAKSWISGVPRMRMRVLYRFRVALQRLVLYVNGELFLMLMSTQAHCTHTTILTNNICSVSGSRCKPLDLFLLYRTRLGHRGCQVQGNVIHSATVSAFTVTA